MSNQTAFAIWCCDKLIIYCFFEKTNKRNVLQHYRLVFYFFIFTPDIKSPSAVAQPKQRHNICLNINVWPMSSGTHDTRPVCTVCRRSSRCSRLPSRHVLLFLTHVVLPSTLSPRTINTLQHSFIGNPGALGRRQRHARRPLRWLNQRKLLSARQAGTMVFNLIGGCAVRAQAINTASRVS